VRAAPFSTISRRRLSAPAPRQDRRGRARGRSNLEPSPLRPGTSARPHSCIEYEDAWESPPFGSFARVIWYAPKLGAVVKSSHVSPGNFDFELAAYKLN
jgi:hypothetical protein